jgi:hypothetical protein
MKIRTKATGTGIKTKKAVRVPRAGTLAEYVCARPLTETAMDVARAARGANPEWRDTTWRRVYQLRWYYGLTERPRVPAPTAASTAPAPAPAAADRGELVRMIARHGIDAARDAIATVEKHTEALARESA